MRISNYNFHSLTDIFTRWLIFNTLRPRQNGRHFADDTFKRIFVNENVRISINISLKFVPKGLINNILRRPGDKPLSEPMMVNLLAHICVTRPQWVKDINLNTLEAHCLTKPLSEPVLTSHWWDLNIISSFNSNDCKKDFNIKHNCKLCIHIVWHFKYAKMSVITRQNISERATWFHLDWIDFMDSFHKRSLNS